MRDRHLLKRLEVKVIFAATPRHPFTPKRTSDVVDVCPPPSSDTPNLTRRKSLRVGTLKSSKARASGNPDGLSVRTGYIAYLLNNRSDEPELC